MNPFAQNKKIRGFRKVKRRFPYWLKCPQLKLVNIRNEEVFHVSEAIRTFEGYHAI